MLFNVREFGTIVVLLLQCTLRCFRFSESVTDMSSPSSIVSAQLIF